MDNAFYLEVGELSLWFRYVVPMFIIRLFDYLPKLKKGHYLFYLFMSGFGILF